MTQTARESISEVGPVSQSQDVGHRVVADQASHVLTVVFS